MQMKSVFLYSQHNPKMDLQKIDLNIYYNRQQNKFYKLNLMPNCTVFVNEDVQNRPFFNLITYDPNFYMINKLFRHKKIKKQELHESLRNREWNSLNLQCSNGPDHIYIYEKQKIFNFLEKKVLFIQKYFQQHNPFQRFSFKLLKVDDESICQDTIVLLKNQLNNDLVNEFVKQRYNKTQSKKMIPQFEQSEALKPKPTKNNKKPAQKNIQIPKNQQTLFSSWKKK